MKKKLFIGVYHPSIILTYIGVFCALVGIAACFGVVSFNSISQMSLAFICGILAAICDLFDGTIARAFKNRTEIQKAFGTQLDSLADMVSFVCLPACILISFCNNKLLAIPGAMLYVFCGIMRLGWFNVITDPSMANNPDTPKDGRSYFYGAPVTTSTFLIPIVGIILRFCNPPTIICDISLVISFAIISIAFISNFKFKKPGKVGCVIIGAAALAVITLICIIR